METRAEWLEKRRGKIGASNAPIIMGTSEWMTPFELWEQYTGRNAHDQTNPATERGNLLEPRARAAYELQHHVDMPAVELTHPEIPFLSASLDGWNSQVRSGDRVVSRWLELKCPGKSGHQLAIEGKIPDHYKWQMVAQGAVCRGDEGHYWSYWGPSANVFEIPLEMSGKLVVYKRDLELEAQWEAKAKEFWNYVQTDTPPPFVRNDFRRPHTRVAKALFRVIKEALASGKASPSDLRTAQDSVVEQFPFPRVLCEGVAMIRREERVDFELSSL